MTLIGKTTTLSLLAASGLALSGCGDAVSTEELAKQFAATCVTSFTEEGGPASMAQPFCDCSVEEIKEQELGPLDLINQETMEAIGEECMISVMEGQGIPMGEAEQEAPAE